MAWTYGSVGFAGLRIPTRVVACEDSVNRHKGDYICDGTDDQITLNAALNSLPSGGGWLHLLDGTARITGPIIYPGDNVKFSGSGQSTIIQTGSDIKMFDLKGLSRPSIVDMQLHGSGASSANHNAINLDGVVQSYFSRITFKDVTTAFNFRGGCVSNTIENSRMQDCGWNAIRLALAGSASFTKIHGCTITGSGQHGIILGPQSVYSDVSNNTVGNSGFSGVFMSVSSYNDVSNNVIAFNSRHGIEGSIASHNVISSNRCLVNDVNDTGSFDGINLDTSSSDNIISGNKSLGNDRYGVGILNATCLRNLVTNNHLRGNTSDSVFDLGTDSQVFNNIED